MGRSVDRLVAVAPGVGHALASGVVIGVAAPLGPAPLGLAPVEGAPVVVAEAGGEHGGRGDGPFAGWTPTSDPRVPPAIASARIQPMGGLPEPERCMSMVHRDTCSLAPPRRAGNCQEP